jgi:hypothetical protein
MLGIGLGRALHPIARSTLFQVDNFFAAFRPSRDSEFVFQSVSPSVAQAERFALWAHYDPGCVFDDCLIDTAAQLRKAGYAILLVSTSRPPKESRANGESPYLGFAEKALRHVDAVFMRRGGGKDIGSYVAALRWLTRKLNSAPDRILWLNDSVYGPLYPLQRYLSPEATAEHNVYSLTTSYQFRLHPQTYFVLFNTERPAVWEELQRFAARYRHVAIRNNLVYRYEIGLPKAMPRTFADAHCFFPIHEAARIAVAKNASFTIQHGTAPGTALFHNPHHLYANELHLDLKHPFIKRELLEVNPLGVDLRPLIQFLAADEKRFNCIVNHLGRTRRRTPFG